MLGSLISWAKSLARQRQKAAWNEDPVNLHVPKKLQDPEHEDCHTCVGCPLIVKCGGGVDFLEMIDDLQTGGE